MKLTKILTVAVLLLVFFALLTGCSGDGQEVQRNSDEAEPEAGLVNTIDFSGRWSGTVLIAEVKNSEELKYMEGAVFDCDLDLDIDENGDGFADIYLDDELAGPDLVARVAQDRPHLVGELFSSPFELYGTFSDESGEWTFTGGGDTIDEEVVIHLVFNLTGSASQAGTAQSSEEPDSPVPGVSADAPLDQFLVGSWMADELFGEYRVKTFKADGTAIHTMDKPGGSGDDINNWPNGDWTIVESASGTWRVSGTTLITEVEPEFLGLDTEVKIIDENTIEIWELHTKTLYYRVPQ
jgi:hypothetical protein